MTNPSPSLPSPRCVFVGDEALVHQCALQARAAGLEVVALASRHEGARRWAADEGIAVLDSHGDLAAQLAEVPFDALLSVAYLRMLPDAVLALAPVAVNFHDGPLPAYAGLNVTSWALLAGETTHAVTWHLVTSGIDAGDVVLTAPVAIEPDDTAFSLNARCYEAALQSFPTIAAALADGSLTATPQPAGERTVFYRHQRPARATLVDSHRPAAATVRLARALDLGPRQRHTLGALRLVLGDRAYLVDASRALDGTPGAAPGTVVSLDDAGLRLATVEGDLLVASLTTLTGERVGVRDVAARHGLGPGARVPAPDAALATALDELDPTLARHEAHHATQLRHTPTDLPIVAPASRVAGWGEVDVPVPPGSTVATLVAAAAAWAARVTGRDEAVVAYTDAAGRAALSALGPLGRAPLLHLPVPSGTALPALATAVDTALADAGRRGPWLADLVGRDPALRAAPPAAPTVAVEVGAGPADRAPAGATVCLRVAADGSALRLDHRLDALDPAQAARFAGQLATLLAAAAADPDAPARRLPLLGPADVAAYAAANDTTVDYDRAATVDGGFRVQVARTPEAPALSFGATTLTYAALAARVDAMAGALRAAGVDRADRVGIATDRGLDMVVAVLATMACGAAYLPLDPTYPHDRLGFMVDDAGLRALVAGPALEAVLQRPGVAVVRPDAWQGATAAAPVDHDPTDLAYVIYTSGSTGKPKGVMLEHRNVVNFFAAMDRVIDTDPPGVWLAVTSLSFDISVLELLWTVTRGFHVVLKPDRPQPAHAAGSDVGLDRPVALSLFYFAANETTDAEGYRLLLEGARFADTNGLDSVWIPERHFHEFGGIYPNPAVAAAAVAAVTQRVNIRAGSVVAPLHHPARIAEEWSVVDNISGGRVGIAVASGWQPNDFVLQPQNYATNKAVMMQTVDTVRRLWRGETVTMDGPIGPVEVRTLPRPVQPELPVWVTSAGSVETFEAAGRAGYRVLTHLLGQSVEAVGEKVGRYRAAWREAGHPGEGHVTLMLHTFLDGDRAHARATASPHLKGYLRSAAGLLKDMASAFPTLRNAGADADELFRSMGEDELSQLLDMATERYLDTSGLFGDLDDARAMVTAVAGVGVDEVACLIDFGVQTDTVIASLPLLARLREWMAAAPAPEGPAADGAGALDETAATLVARHGCTHLQCTPSLAAMLLADPDDRAALGRIRHLMVGGEALPTALAQELRSVLPGRFTNMYGPTETTIWSLVHELGTVPDGPVPIGTAIANTTIAVLDADGTPLPMGAFGELHLGGDGVARGYHARAELTAERFVDRPGHGRLYATGDVARLHPDGHVEFAGRADFQVKIRGHRIELGEIETVLDRHPDVVQSVVTARDDGAGNVALVAYVLLHAGRPADGEALRAHVGATLPEIMVPAAVVDLDAFPLTPNGKIDRRALPAPASLAAPVTATSAPPAEGNEQLVAGVWASVLGRPVGRDDNFFEIGGHSLLAVKVFRLLVDEGRRAVALTDVFRYPTVRAFAAYLDARDTPRATGPAAGDGDDDGGSAPTAGIDRGALRRRALGRRGGS